MINAIAGAIRGLSAFGELGDAVAKQIVEAQARTEEVMALKLATDAMQKFTDALRYDGEADAMLYAKMSRQQGKMAMEARRLEPISINKYNTPTERNVGCSWSLGLLNLTEPEVEAIISFVQDIGRQRSARANDYSREKRAKLLTEIVENGSAERKRMLTGVFDVPIEDETKPEPKGNRFSGLDIE